MGICAAMSLSKACAKKRPAGAAPDLHETKKRPAAASPEAGQFSVAKGDDSLNRATKRMLAKLARTYSIVFFVKCFVWASVAFI